MLKIPKIRHKADDPNEGTVMVEERQDIVVLGGGPAGAFSAYLLCRAGYSVALVDPDRTPARIEGVSPRVLAALAAADITADGLTISAAAERRSFWTGTGSSANSEFLTDRAVFDRALRDIAAHAGVRVHRGDVAGWHEEEGAVVACLKDGSELRGRLVIDARGRRAPRQTGGPRGPMTVSASAWTMPTDTTAGPRTTIVPAPGGWVWLAEPGDGRAWVQVCFDAGQLTGSGPDAVADVAGRILADGAVIEALGAPVAPSSPYLVRACETVFANPDFTPPVIRVGDAAAGLDPLSGHGMFWAVSSALSIVPVVAAVISGDPGEAALAKRFVEQRARDMFLRQARVGRDFYRLESRWADAPFWAPRRAFPDDAPIHEPVETIHIARSVVVDNGRLAEVDVLVTPAHPGGVAWVAGVPIVPVYNDIRRRGAAPVTARALGPSIGPGATPEQADIVFHWLHRNGLAAA